MQGVRMPNPVEDIWVENGESARAFTDDSHDPLPEDSSLHSQPPYASAQGRQATSVLRKTECPHGVMPLETSYAGDVRRT